MKRPFGRGKTLLRGLTNHGYLVGGFNPFEKHAQVKLDHETPGIGVKIKKYLSCHHLDKFPGVETKMLYLFEKLKAFEITPPQQKSTNIPMKRDHFQRTFHLPSINVHGIC